MVTHCRRLAGAGVALVALLAAGARAESPSLLSGMPPEVLSLRDRMLDRSEYSSLADRWRQYAESHPESAVALVMRSRAMRYADEGDRAGRAALVRKANALDPSCPEALEALAAMAMGEDGSVPPDEARALAERAVELAPDWPRPHFTLWSLAMADGDAPAAAAHAAALVDKGGIPSPLLDFGHNLLVSADENAVVFTNGDNDTYPPCALQAKTGLRTDVRVANLSLLNVLGYAIQVLGDGPLSGPEIRELYDSWEHHGRGTGTMFSTRLVDRVVEKVRAGEWTSPVYFAVTVADPVLLSVPQKMRVEGLLWRVLPEPGSGAGAGEPEIEYAKSLRLIRDELRLESATDVAFPWERRSSVRKLMTNYPALMRIVATAAAERGDLGAFRDVTDRALRILAFHGDRETEKALREYRREIDPEARGT